METGSGGGARETVCDRAAELPLKINDPASAERRDSGRPDIIRSIYVGTTRRHNPAGEGDRRMRLVRALALLALLAAASCTGSPPGSIALSQDQPFRIRSSAVPFKLDDAAATRVGRLVWRGGVSLSGNSEQFGGWSDLDVAPDGSRLSAVSDVGGWMTAAIDYDARGNLGGLSEGRFGQLRGLDGQPLAAKRDADAEAMVRLPDGSWLVGFEQRHRIWRYPPGDEAAGEGLAGIPIQVEGPPQLQRQPSNGGMEAMTRSRDGRIVLMSEEHSEAAGTTMGWIGVPLGNGYLWSSFRYATIPDFRVTSMARLADGSFVTLERAFDMLRGVRVRVMQFDAAQLASGGAVTAQELARLALPYAVDNLEAVATTSGRRGETLLWLLSDDNFNKFQRTLLLLFELAAP